MSRSNVYGRTTAVCCVFSCARVRVHVPCVQRDSAHLGERATFTRMLHIAGWQAQYWQNNRLSYFRGFLWGMF